MTSLRETTQSYKPKDDIDDVISSFQATSLNDEPNSNVNILDRMGRFVRYKDHWSHNFNDLHKDVQLYFGRNEGNKAVARLLEYGVYFQSGFLPRSKDWTTNPTPSERTESQVHLDLDLLMAETALVSTIRRSLNSSIDKSNLLDGIELKSPSSLSFAPTNNLLAYIARIKILENFSRVMKSRVINGSTMDEPSNKCGPGRVNFANRSELTTLILAIFKAAGIALPKIDPGKDIRQYASHAEPQALAYFISRQPHLGYLLRPASEHIEVLPQVFSLQINKQEVCPFCLELIEALMQVFRFELQIFGPDADLLLKYDADGNKIFPPSGGERA